MKVTLPITMVLGGLLLVGAGCQQGPVPTTSTPSVADINSATTPATTTDQVTVTTDFTLTATSDAYSAVKMSWSTPTDASVTATIRLLHSANPNIEFPGRAFWHGLAKDKTSFEWVGVPSGKRYFRACVFEKGACTIYSNEVEVNVK